MKALILAAGYGTRLLPYTHKIPKPLFTINSRPILEHLVHQLQGHGCDEIFINAHHLHEQIEIFVKTLPGKIHIVHEPEILDTGGAIANVRKFIGQEPFFVINSDVISDIDLSRVYEAHLSSGSLATLVLHDFKPFNKVSMDSDGYICSFESESNGLTFTGIQVLSPEIFNFFPEKTIFSSIDIYKRLIHLKKIKAFMVEDIFWSDIGTTAAYSTTSLLLLAASVFSLIKKRIKDIKIDQLAGDGSDRLWFRLSYGGSSIIAGDHGISLKGTDSFKQLKAFIDIGRHLHSKGLPIPKILDYDMMSGIVVTQDLGDLHLEAHIKKQITAESSMRIYQRVIDGLIDFSVKGIHEFNPKWTCQSESYSKEVILEKECSYFMDAFIKGYLNLKLQFDDFRKDFEYIADRALDHAIIGLIHRDCQSRNIMMVDDQPFFIDFQSARIGPLQYDLASLLIDPYVRLDEVMQEKLLCYAIKRLNLNLSQKKAFIKSYRFCCLTRNLQFLGAFSYLSQIKKKIEFEKYIPYAVSLLKKQILNLNDNNISNLFRLIQTI